MTVSYKTNSGYTYYFDLANGTFAMQLADLMKYELDSLFTNAEDRYNNACAQGDAVAKAGGFESSWYFKDEDEMKRFHCWIEGEAPKDLHEQYEDACSLEYRYGCEAVEKLEKLEHHLLEAFKIAEELELDYDLK